MPGGRQENPVSFRSGLIKTFGGTGLDAVAPAALVDQHTPAAWTATPFGPGAPMRPLGGLVDNGEPRTIDYPHTVNSTITPRSFRCAGAS